MFVKHQLRHSERSARLAEDGESRREESTILSIFNGWWFWRKECGN